MQMSVYQLTDLSRCPHCGVANPQMVKQWKSDAPLKGARDFSRTNIGGHFWGAYSCTTCGAVVLAKSKLILNRLNNVNALVGVLNPNDGGEVEALFPANQRVAEELPAQAKSYFAQALESLHAPDGAVMLAASAVDAMLKNRGYRDGGLYARIEQATQDHLLTPEMAEWAHKVRLDANDVRHADDDRPHLTEAMARQVLDFVGALGEILFVLPSRVHAGIEAAAP